MIQRVGIGILSLALLAGLSWALLSLPAMPAGLTAESLAKLPESGVTNPVTAVLLNYRGYDTLLEVGVLLLAIVGVWSLRRGEWPAGDLRDRPLLMSLLRVLLPVLVLSAGYLLWIGAFAPGGAFQGGALLGGALVLVMLGGLARRFIRRDRLLRFGLVLGVLVFAAVCAVTKLLTGGLLQYPAGSGGTWIMVIESAALISIGLTLGLLYLGGRPLQNRRSFRKGFPPPCLTPTIEFTCSPARSSSSSGSTRCWFSRICCGGSWPSTSWAAACSWFTSRSERRRPARFPIPCRTRWC